MSPPNILFIVWDACRLDFASKYAPNLSELAEDNLRFQNAITPGGYSFPAHASIVTGEYPHEHGMFSRTDEFRSTPLLNSLGERGYTRYGVSANGFASPRYGFDESFDEFYNTQGQMVFPEGLDIHAYARRVEEEGEEFSTEDVSYTDLLKATVGHDRPLKSLANVAAAGVSELAGTYPVLRKIPHHRFNQYHEFAYSPRQNTKEITSILEREADRDAPFFLFTNYMDAHHPYAPPKRLQREFCDQTFSYYELSELAEVSHPWGFMQRIEDGEALDQERIEQIRSLYAGEVRRADEHLGKLLETLERTGLDEDTLVVVTADHGENLGETNRMGETRMGHECSASDHLLRVPLVVAHPLLNGREVREFVSLKDLSPLFTEGIHQVLRSRGDDLRCLHPDDGIVASEIPPPANDALIDKYPDLSDVLDRSMVATYTDKWKVVMTSHGFERAWSDGVELPLGEAPEELVETCRANLESLVEQTRTDNELSPDERSHLEALGYL